MRTNLDTTTRIITCPSPLNPKGYAASVWRTTNGWVWEHGGTSHAGTPELAERDSRRWLLKEDENATVLAAGARALSDTDYRARLLGEAAEIAAAA